MHWSLKWVTPSPPSALHRAPDSAPPVRLMPTQWVARGELACHQATSASDDMHRFCGVGSSASSHGRASDSHTATQSVL